VSTMSSPSHVLYEVMVKKEETEFFVEKGRILKELFSGRQKIFPSKLLSRYRILYCKLRV
jgi:hypothetical protein